VKTVPRDKYDYTPERRQFFQDLCDIKFGKGRDVLRAARRAVRLADHLAPARIHRRQTGGEVGAATLYLEGKELAFYYYAFYDLNYYARNLGMFMMTSAVALFCRTQLQHLYLGTCYSQNALYKRSLPARIFQRFPLVKQPRRTEIYHPARQKGTLQHLLETDEYRGKFYKGGLEKIRDASGFRVKVK